MLDKKREQFSEIYDQCIEQIYRFVYVKVNSQEIAEDLTSKVFLKGWEAYSSNNQIDSPRAFLYKIARNAVTDFYREKGRTNIISADFAIYNVKDRTNLEKKALLDSDLEVVKKALQGLSDDYQNVIIWHYLDDLSILEVAKLLDRTEEATRVLLHRALKSLKKELEGIQEA